MIFYSNLQICGFPAPVMVTMSGNVSAAEVLKDNHDRMDSQTRHFLFEPVESRDLCYGSPDH
jgi:hypothetical protein